MRMLGGRSKVLMGLNIGAKAPAADDISIKIADQFAELPAPIRSNPAPRSPQHLLLLSRRKNRAADRLRYTARKLLRTRTRTVPRVEFLDRHSRPHGRHR